MAMTRQPYWDFMRDGKTPQERALDELARLSQEFEMERQWGIYLAGSLRNPAIPSIHRELELLTGQTVFSDWYAAGPEADDHWKAYYKGRGVSYREALKRPASVNTFNFDQRNMLDGDAIVLALPAGKSGHMELGWMLGQGRPGYILLDSNEDRWDVMYQFATGVTADMEELATWLKNKR